MKRQRLAAVGLAVAGFGAIVLGIHQEALHVAPGYAGVVESGWDGRLNHEERLLARVGALGIAGAVATVRWKYLATVPMAAGGVALFYPVRAVLRWTEHPGLYTDVATHDGGTIRVVLGAEPFLLAAGGTLLVAAAVVGWRSHASRTDASETSAAPSATT